MEECSMLVLNLVMVVSSTLISVRTVWVTTCSTLTECYLLMVIPMCTCSTLMLVFRAFLPSRRSRWRRCSRPLPSLSRKMLSMGNRVRMEKVGGILLVIFFVSRILLRPSIMISCLIVSVNMCTISLRSWTPSTEIARLLVLVCNDVDLGVMVCRTTRLSYALVCCRREDYETELWSSWHCHSW